MSRKGEQDGEVEEVSLTSAPLPAQERLEHSHTVLRASRASSAFLDEICSRSIDPQIQTGKSNRRRHLDSARNECSPRVSLKNDRDGNKRNTRFAGYE